MTKRQQIVLKYIQALYLDGTLPSATPPAQVTARATGAFAHDVAGFVAARGGQKIADFIEAKAREFASFLRGSG